MTTPKLHPKKQYMVSISSPETGLVLSSVIVCLFTPETDPDHYNVFNLYDRLDVTSLGTHLMNEIHKNQGQEPSLPKPRVTVIGTQGSFKPDPSRSPIINECLACNQYSTTNLERTSCPKCNTPNYMSYHH